MNCENEITKAIELLLNSMPYANENNKIEIYNFILRNIKHTNINEKQLKAIYQSAKGKRNG